MDGIEYSKRPNTCLVMHAICSYNERWDFPTAGSSLFLAAQIFTADVLKTDQQYASNLRENKVGPWYNSFFRILRYVKGKS